MKSSDSLFSEPAVRITSIVDGAHGLLRIKHQRTTLAMLTKKEVEELGLAVNQEWTIVLASAAQLRMRAREGLKLCLRWLKAGDRSTHELHERLLAKGLTPEQARAALALLAATKLQNDAELAKQTRSKLEAKGQSSRVIADALQAKGLDGGQRESSISDHARAHDLAKKLAAKHMRADLSATAATAALRRVLAALARAGYEEDVARMAARAAIPQQHRSLLDE